MLTKHSSALILTVFVLYSICLFWHLKLLKLLLYYKFLNSYLIMNLGLEILWQINPESSPNGTCSWRCNC